CANAVVHFLTNNVMPRVALDPATDDELRRQAQLRRMSSEDLAAAYVRSGISSAQRSRFRSWVKFLGACLLTAAVVLIGLRWLSSSVYWLPSIQFPLDRLLHWARVFVLALVPWPITILIALWLIARSDSAFALFLGLFGFLRRVKLFGAEIEINE